MKRFTLCIIKIIKGIFFATPVNLSAAWLCGENINI